MSPTIARQVLREIQKQAHSAPAPPIEGLSAREREVLLGLERGLAYREIAATLQLSVHTVNTHVKHLYEKLHVRNRQEALRTTRLRA